jgi:hypothetical protein
VKSDCWLMESVTFSAFTRFKRLYPVSGEKFYHRTYPCV